MSKNKQESIEEIVSDVIEEVDVEEIIEVAEEVEAPTLLKLIAVVDANVRVYPNHKSAKVKVLRTNTEMEIIDIVEGVLVQGSNVWYQIADGYVHFSQVKEL